MNFNTKSFNFHSKIQMGTGLQFWVHNKKSFFLFERQHEISNNVVCATSIGSFAGRLNILWLLSFWPKIFWVSKSKRRLHRLVWVYTCPNTTMLEITCHNSSQTKHLLCYSKEPSHRDGSFEHPKHRTLVKSGCQKNIFSYFSIETFVVLLKRTVSLRWFFWAPKTYV